MEDDSWRVFEGLLWQIFRLKDKAEEWMKHDQSINLTVKRGMAKHTKTNISFLQTRKTVPKTCWISRSVWSVHDFYCLCFYAACISTSIYVAKQLTSQKENESTRAAIPYCFNIFFAKCCHQNHTLVCLGWDVQLVILPFAFQLIQISAFSRLSPRELVAASMGCGRAQCKRSFRLTPLWLAEWTQTVHDSIL